MVADKDTESGNYQRVASVADFADGEIRKVIVDGKSVAIFPLEDGFVATTAICPHAGGPIDEGDVEGKVVTCPWHGLSYDLNSGDCVDDPEFKLKCYAVRVDGDDIFVAV